MNLDFDQLLLIRSALDIAIAFESDTNSSGSIYVELYSDLRSVIDGFIHDEYGKKIMPF